MTGRTEQADVDRGGAAAPQRTIEVRRVVGLVSSNGSSLWCQPATMSVYEEVPSAGARILVRIYHGERRPAANPVPASGGQGAASAEAEDSSMSHDDVAADSAPAAAAGAAGAAAAGAGAGRAVRFGEDPRTAAVYRAFSRDQTTGVPVATPYGTVNARYNRGAPYITSAQGEYGNAKVGTSYDDFLAAFAASGLDDRTTAQALLDQDAEAFEGWAETRAAAMLTATVQLAEEWRKKGAAKIFRALLKMVIDGEITLQKAFDPSYFMFIASANAGRKQVGAIQDVRRGLAANNTLTKNTRQIMAHMSPIRDGDLTSDDEERPKKQQATKRLFSVHEKQKAKAANAAAAAAAAHDSDEDQDASAAHDSEEDDEMADGATR